MKTKPEITDNNYQLTAKELAKLVVIRGENTSKFVDFSAKVLTELGPQTEIEKTLCEKFIILSWKLRRLHEVERNTFNKQSEEHSIDEDTRLHFGHVSHVRVRNIQKIDVTDESITHIAKYQIELEKRTAKTLKQYREEQERNANKNKQ